MKKVSVIIPVYKKEDTLKKCLESVGKQTLKEIEIIIIDDGSPDGCWDIMKEYAKEDNRIITIRQNNKGVSCARNTGLLRAKGEYITFVDADDILIDSMLEELYEKATEYQAQVAACSSKSTRDFICMVLDQEEAIIKMFEDDGFGVSVWGKLYQRELFQTISFPPGVKLGEDMKVLFDVLCFSKDIVFYTKQLYIQQTSLFNSSNKMKAVEVFQSIEIMEYILKKCKRDFLSCIPAVEVGLWKRGVGFYMRLDYSECEEYQIKKIKLHFRNMMFHKSFLCLPIRYKVCAILIFLNPGIICCLSKIREAGEKVFNRAGE